MTAPKKTRILLIDDTSLTRTVLRTMLRDEGYGEVREAKDADAGLKLAQHFSPDLICLDIQMPGKSGLELLLELKAQMPRIAVLMITANLDQTSIEACIKGGADGYICKPFSASKVIDAIDGVLAKTSSGYGV